MASKLGDQSILLSPALLDYPSSPRREVLLPMPVRSNAASPVHLSESTRINMIPGSATNAVSQRERIAIPERTVG